MLRGKMYMPPVAGALHRAYARGPGPTKDAALGTRQGAEIAASPGVRENTFQCVAAGPR